MKMSPNNNHHQHLNQLTSNVINSDNSLPINYLSLENIHLPSSINREDGLEVLGFPVRIENALKKLGRITTVGQFCDCRNDDLLKVKNIGRKSVNYMIQV